MVALTDRSWPNSDAGCDRLQPMALVWSRGVLNEPRLRKSRSVRPLEAGQAERRWTHADQPLVRQRGRLPSVTGGIGSSGCATGRSCRR